MCRLRLRRGAFTARTAAAARPVLSGKWRIDRGELAGFEPALPAIHQGRGGSWLLTGRPGPLDDSSADARARARPAQHGPVASATTRPVTLGEQRAGGFRFSHGFLGILLARGSGQHQSRPGATPASAAGPQGPGVPRLA